MDSRPSKPVIISHVFTLSNSFYSTFEPPIIIDETLPLSPSIASPPPQTIIRPVCEMVASGAAAIVGPKSTYISDVVASICNQLNVPHIVSVNRVADYRKNAQHKFTRNIYPDSVTLSAAITQVIGNFEWQKFGIIYDSDESLIRLNDALQLGPTGYKAMTVHRYPGADMLKPFLKDIARTMQSRIIIDCSIENTIEIIKQGLEVRMMGEYMVHTSKTLSTSADCRSFVVHFQAYFITSLDGHLIDIPELSEVRSNITAVRLMSSYDVDALNVVRQLKEMRKYASLSQFDYMQTTPEYTWNGLRVIFTCMAESMYGCWIK